MECRWGSALTWQREANSGFRRLGSAPRFCLRSWVTSASPPHFPWLGPQTPVWAGPGSALLFAHGGPFAALSPLQGHFRHAPKVSRRQQAQFSWHPDEARSGRPAPPGTARASAGGCGSARDQALPRRRGRVCRCGRGVHERGVPCTREPPCPCGRGECCGLDEGRRWPAAQPPPPARSGRALTQRRRFLQRQGAEVTHTCQAGRISVRPQGEGGRGLGLENGEAFQGRRSRGH